MKIFKRAVIIFLILSPAYSYASDDLTLIKKYNKGVDLYRQGDYEQAGRHFKDLLEENANDVKSLNNLACVYIKDSKYNQAVIKLKFALMAGKDVDANYNLAIATYKRGTYEESETIINEVINSAGMDYKQVSLLSGLVSYNLFKYDSAIRSLTRYMEKNSSSFEALFTIGLAQFKKTNYSEAIETFNQCIEKKSDNALAYYNLANAYLAKGDYNMAVDAFNKALHFNENFAECYFNLATTYLKLKDYKNSTSNFEKYLKIKPDATDKADVKGYIKALKPA